MIHAKTLFAIRLPFDVTLNSQLQQLSVLRFWDRGQKAYFNVFTVANLPKIQSLLTPLYFSEEELIQLIHHAGNTNFEDVELQKWQGRSGIEITPYPAFFRCIEHQKTGPGMKPTMRKHDIPRETVQRVWNVFKNLPKDEYHNFETLAKKICKEFELDRFFTESGHFQKEKLQGTRMYKEYGKFYYFPIAILIHYQCLSRKGQHLARISDEWTEQLDFEPDDDTFIAYNA